MKLLGLISFFCFVQIVYADSVIIKHRQFSITREDILSEINHLPEQLTYLKNNPIQLKEYIDGLYREKTFQYKAIELGLDKTPEFQQQIKLLQRKALVNALLEYKKNNINIPDMSALALTQYQSHPEKYQQQESVEVRHILLKASNCEEMKTQREKLARLLKKLQDNEGSFEDFAKQYSEDKLTAIKGGYLGRITKGDTVDPFEKAAFSLRNPNQLSDIVESPYGVHLIQLIAYYPPQLKPFEQVKADIEQDLKNEYIKNEFVTWRSQITDPNAAQVDHQALDALIDEITNSARLGKAELEKNRSSRELLENPKTVIMDSTSKN